MPERGRPAASSGNAYHDVRVANYLIDFLDNVTIRSVAVETLDAIDDLVIHRSNGTTRYEQVKERAPSGRWTPRRLIDEGIPPTVPLPASSQSERRVRPLHRI